MPPACRARKRGRSRYFIAQELQRARRSHRTNLFGDDWSNESRLQPESFRGCPKLGEMARLWR
jgi:hypothetical protein